jgi:hypothetical protein
LTEAELRRGRSSDDPSPIAARYKIDGDDKNRVIASLAISVED